MQSHLVHLFSFFSSFLRNKNSSFYTAFVVCMRVIAVIQYGAWTSNHSLASSHLASSHTKYDTSFVFSMFYQENENVYVIECVKWRKKNNKRKKYVYVNSIVNSICNKFARSLLHIHIYI